MRRARSQTLCCDWRGGCCPASGRGRRSESRAVRTMCFHPGIFSAMPEDLKEVDEAKLNCLIATSSFYASNDRGAGGLEGASLVVVAQTASMSPPTATSPWGFGTLFLVHKRHLDRAIHLGSADGQLQLQALCRR